MIKPPALLLVADNSGALIGGCIKVAKLNNRLGAVPGTVLTISVKKNLFKKHIKKKSRIIVKGQIVKALLTTSAKSVKR
jgi:ribosomal protein L14